MMPSKARIMGVTTQFRSLLKAEYTVSSNSILLKQTRLPDVRLETQMLSLQQMLEFATLPGLCCLKQYMSPCQLYTISQVPIIASELTGQV
jgi:hypothetical protein